MNTLRIIVVSLILVTSTKSHMLRRECLFGILNRHYLLYIFDNFFCDHEISTTDCNSRLSLRKTECETRDDGQLLQVSRLNFLCVVSL